MSELMGMPAVDQRLARTSEAASLAVEMDDAYRAVVEAYRTHLGLAGDAAEQLVADVERRRGLQQLLSAPVRSLSWLNLGDLTRHDPALADEAWARMKEVAHQELASGHQAARVVERSEPPFTRAEFLALRESFRAEWQPRGGLEDVLIDTLAQAHVEGQMWLARLHTLSATERELTDHDLRIKGEWRAPRVEAAQWIEQAAGMVERFNRLFVRTLRALRDLRRYNLPVVVQNAEQVNVGGQQINVSRRSD
jgi:hypothetical protein